MDGDILAIIMPIAIFAIYFAPALIASSRNNDAKNAIAFVNLVLGWTILGWVACLIWAYSNNKHTLKQTIVKKSVFSVADEIKKLASLKEDGLLTEDEFIKKKEEILNSSQGV